MRVFQPIGRVLVAGLVASLVLAGAAQADFVYAPPRLPPTRIPDLPCATPKQLAALETIMTQWQIDYAHFTTEQAALAEAEAAYASAAAAYEAAMKSGDAAAIEAARGPALAARNESIDDVAKVKSLLRVLNGDAGLWDADIAKIDKSCPPPPKLVTPPHIGGPGRGRPTIELSSVLDEINRARTDPQGYAEVLRRGPQRPGVNEAITFLQTQKPVAALKLDDRLTRAAVAHAADDGALGNASHIGSDGSKLSDRIHAQGLYASLYAEVISIGEHDAQGVVTQLIIDQPGPQHPHRTDLFDPLLTMAGAGCGDNKTYGTMCVIDLSAGAVEGGD